jgi:hypothetical protein
MKVKDLKERLSDFPDNMEVVVGVLLSLPPDHIPLTKVEGRVRIKEDIVAVLDPEDEYDLPSYYYDNCFYANPENQTGVKLHPYSFPGENLPKRKVLMLNVCVDSYRL